jgi:hypothetical protein
METKPWYQSKTILVAGLIALAGFLEAVKVVPDVPAVIVGVLGALAIVFRAMATTTLR